MKVKCYEFVMKTDLGIMLKATLQQNVLSNSPLVESDCQYDSMSWPN